MRDEELVFIGSILGSETNYHLIEGIFKPEYLDDEIAKAIFENYSSDLLEISKKTGIEFKYLIELSNNIVRGYQFKAYAEKIFDNWKSKKKDELIKQPINKKLLQELNKIEDTKLFTNYQIEDISKLFLKKAERQYKGEKTEMLETGFNGLNKIIEGFDKSELIFLAGSAGMGKTTLAINFAYNIAKNNKKVLFFSLEMKEIEIHERLVKHITEIGYFRNMTYADFEKITKISKAIQERLMLKVNDLNLTLEQMYNVILDEKPELVIIDHLNILTTSERFKTELERLEYQTRRLKEMAKEFNIPIICLCQLNRSNSDREVKFPTLSDLRGSGSIEQDANLVLFVYRPEYFLLQAKPDETSKKYIKWEEDYNYYKGKAKIVVAKNRRGATGEIMTVFKPEIYKFIECG